MVRDHDNFESLRLETRLLRAINKRNYEVPTPVQTACIRAALDGKDVVARARTGSGKTLAYLLPAMQRLLLLPEAQQTAAWQILILVPTKELCEQVKEETDLLAAESGLDIRSTALTATGAGQADQFLHIGQVVIATPGKIAQALKSGKLRAQALQPNLSQGRPGLRSLVLDEADLILSMTGYDKDLQELAPKVPRSCQCMLMSATTNVYVERLEKLILRNAVTLDLLENSFPEVSAINSDAGADAAIAHFFLHLPKNDKHLCVMTLLKLGMVQQSVLLFVNSTEAGYKLRLFLENFGVKSAVINAELPLNSRHHILQEFNRGLFDYLIATDDSSLLDRGSKGKVPLPVQSHKNSNKRKHKEMDSEFGVTRGIDFQGVKTVINVDAPSSVAEYVHRVGRTGRAGKSGTAITILTSTDADLEARLNQEMFASEATSSGGWQEFPMPVKKSMEALRYRGDDIARSLTKKVIKEARAKELRLELINSHRLSSHFEEHPGDLALLKHDKSLAKRPEAPHLKHLPSYLKSNSKPISTNPGAALPASKRQKESKGVDPIKGGFLRASKRGEEMQPLTEMELRAQKYGKKLAKKEAAKAGHRELAFMPKKNVRKKR